MQKNPNVQHSMLNDELLFLIACCQTDPSDDDINFILTYLSQLNSYQSLISAATQHGIVPLVYKTIKELSQNTSDSSYHTEYLTLDTFLSELKPFYLSIAQNNMLMSGELIKIMHLLKEHDIESLAFKGPTLAQMAYGDITLREYADLDILVKKEDIYKVDTLFKEHNYERSIKLTTRQEKLWIKLKHDLGLYNPKNNILFEIHWSLMDEDYPIQMDTSAFWLNPKAIYINQQEIKTFSTEDLLLYLCIHGSTHLWERIEWIKDIDMIIQTQPLDWDHILRKAKNLYIETIFDLGIYQANELFGTDIPTSIMERISHEKKLPSLSNYIQKRWQKDRREDIFGTLQRTLAYLKLFPNFKAQISYLHKILLKPTLNEYDYIELPTGMYWAYYLVRPYLLAKKHISKN